MIGSSQHAETGLTQLELERIPECLPARWIATTSLVARVSNVAADEDMVRKRSHVVVPRIYLEEPSGNLRKKLEPVWLPKG